MLRDGKGPFVVLQAASFVSSTSSSGGITIKPHGVIYSDQKEAHWVDIRDVKDVIGVIESNEGPTSAEVETMLRCFVQTVSNVPHRLKASNESGYSLRPHPLRPSPAPLTHSSRGSSRRGATPAGTLSS